MTTSFQKSLAAVLLASTVVGGFAYAAEQTAVPGSVVETPAQRTVDRDVGKLSKDGAKALRDMNGARLAIFDAQPKQAKEKIDLAEAALARAKTDTSVFLKAESELKSPANKAKAGPASSDVNEKLAWLPVDGQLTLGEDFVATPEKAAAVADANKHLQKGDKQGALEKLKLAHIDVNLTLAVLPLEKTTADVKQAATLIDQGKYYEANAVLKTAEDRVRFDVVDTILMPQAAAKAPNTKAADTTGSTQPAKSADTKPAAK
jgi:hypothetical protein